MFADRKLKSVYTREFSRRQLLMESQGWEFRNGDVAKRIEHLRAVHNGAFQLAAATVLNTVDPAGRRGLEEPLLERWAQRFVGMSAAQVLDYQG